MLLYLVDFVLFDESVDLVVEVMVIVGELCKYDEVFYEKLCWFVFNKLDMVLEDECEVCVVDFFDCFGWDGFVFEILVLMG